jgi:hypothetical protein
MMHFRVVKYVAIMSLRFYKFTRPVWCGYWFRKLNLRLGVALSGVTFASNLLTIDQPGQKIK